MRARRCGRRPFPAEDRVGEQRHCDGYGTGPEFGTVRGGQRHRDEHHPFVDDLDLFGRSSLFAGRLAHSHGQTQHLEVYTKLGPRTPATT